MFGTFRFLLACTVAMGHIGYAALLNISTPVTAVIGFYLISGYVMTGLIRNYYMGLPSVPKFYLDRLLRIYPQYVFFLCVSLVLFFFLKVEDPHLSSGFNLQRLSYNLLIIPLDFYMFLDASGFLLIPPTWSLGLEVCFYLLIPFLLMMTRARALGIIISLFIFTLATFNVVDSDVWGYRLVPGTLYVFLLGSLLYDQQLRSIRYVLVYLAVLMVLVMAVGEIRLPHTIEIYVGISIGFPLLYVLSKRRKNKYDDLLGNISYGVFLSHYLVRWFYQAIYPHYLKLTGTEFVLFYLACAITLGAFGYYAIELPFLRLRKQMRVR